MYFEQFFVLNRAVDGAALADWKHNTCTLTEQSDSPWLVIDLQGNFEIVYVNILNRGDCCGK